jgi:formylglycine-generating enzyme required for sulfatase activity
VKFSHFTLLILVFAMNLKALAVDNISQLDTYRACQQCPEMVAVPKGTFKIGSTEFNEDEQPVKDISINAFAVSRFEITVAEYKQFIDEMNFKESSPCLTMGEDGSWFFNQEAAWNNVGFEQDDNHPVVCVSWTGAKAYIKWLNTKLKDGAPKFRLLTESEWEYAAKAGSHTTFWWGSNEQDFCKYTNGVDATAFAIYPHWKLAGKCDDGFVYTAPVGHFNKPNAFGLQDMIGNVWEWVEDCYVDNFKALANNGEAQTSEPCEKRVFRGGAWGDYGSFYLRSTYRGAWAGDGAFANIGFRIAQDRP